jgi:rhamnose utilization protein RhaD (predicted bifunctional aldolase and dehydrogenase)/NAD(P)-dependent dehydrogenase (short-subunit alcohol dehydrogenase family)
MKNEWDELEAATYEGEPRDLVYATRLLGRDEALGLYGGCNASAKLNARNLVGEVEELLFIDHGHQASSCISADGFTTLRREPLTRLTNLGILPVVELSNEIACSRTRAASPVPPVDALLHVVLPYRYIFMTRPDAILAVANSLDGTQCLSQLYGESLQVVEYSTSSLLLAKACREALSKADPEKLTGIFIPYQGLLTFGESARQAYERLVSQITRAEQYLKNHTAWFEPLAPVTSDIAQPSAGDTVRQELAVLRQAISNLDGSPLILSVQSDSSSLNFCRRNDLVNLTQVGPAIAAHTVLTKRVPLIGRDVDAYRVTCEQARIAMGAGLQSRGCDLAPRILLDPVLGLCALGYNATEATLAGRIYRHTIDVILRANALTAYKSLPFQVLLEAESSASQVADDFTSTSEKMFMGEIALVTGGASGIGKACVESLLRRGAAVVNLDINPSVESQFHRPDYLGLICDLTDETAVLASFETLAHAFGGLDMLVLNAGIFPAGCRIESLTLTVWQRVMRINLDSNLVVLREAYPLLKHSPRGGRVLVNASKNVLAPGAGAAAYSASKAAITQMARVAALEWGKDRIRVNLIHPDAIFDTGVWTEEVLQARAAHYGMTVQQYKTRNVLGVELNSHYVGELVAEMLGPRFEKITGAQIPVDGGSDRVI